MPADRETTRSGRGAGRGRLDVVVACALLAACACVVAGLAWTRPTTSSKTVSYTQTGHLAYWANVSPASVYGSSRLTTGQPAYGELVRALRIGFSYELRAPVPVSLAGTERLVATIANGQGLTRTVPLQPVTSFAGARFHATGVLRLAALRALANAFDRAAGNHSRGSYAVTISPSAKVYGRVGGVALHTTFDPAATFTLTPIGLVPGSTGPGFSAGNTSSQSQGQQNPFAPTSTGTVTLPAARPATLVAGVPVGDARRASLVALAVALLVGALAGWSLLRNATAEDERVRIATRYPGLLVEADALPDPAGATTVELSSIEDLVQVARRLESAILHVGGEADVYAVVDAGTLYRYASGRAAGVRSRPPAPASAPSAETGTAAETEQRDEVLAALNGLRNGVWAPPATGPVLPPAPGTGRNGERGGADGAPANGALRSERIEAAARAGIAELIRRRELDRNRN